MAHPKNLLTSLLSSVWNDELHAGDLKKSGFLAIQDMDRQSVVVIVIVRSKHMANTTHPRQFLDI
jgi:hypothetical protein